MRGLEIKDYVVIRDNSLWSFEKRVASWWEAFQLMMAGFVRP